MHALRASAESPPIDRTDESRPHIIDLRERGSHLVIDPSTRDVYELIRRLAISNLPVLITGATGVGKDHAAHALHEWSKRSSGPFVVLNCAAVPDALIESELFGHRRGAFTGATEAKAGLLEAAHGGSLFLDEIGELSEGAQAKLLRAVEAGQLKRVGDTVERSVDVRLITATNRDLERRVIEGHFRHDLFFRLTAAVVAIPALRDRPIEILPLARHFLAKACAALGRPSIEISKGGERTLLEHPWTGNVRELRNAMEFVATTCEGQSLSHEHAIVALRKGGSPRRPNPVVREESQPQFRRLADEVVELERSRIEEALLAAGGVQARAANLLDVPLRTFVNKVRRYNLHSMIRKR